MAELPKLPPNEAGWELIGESEPMFAYDAETDEWYPLWPVKIMTKAELLKLYPRPPKT